VLSGKHFWHDAPAVGASRGGKDLTGRDVSEWKGLNGKGHLVVGRT